MGVQEEILRIQTARDTLRNKAVELKISAGTEKIDELADDYDAIVNQGSLTAQVKEGETYTIPKGYHDGTGTVSGVAGGGNYNLQSKQITPTKKPQQVTPDEGYYGMSDVTVQAIPNQYQDVSSVTAVADDVLSTKIFVDSDGEQVAGTMLNNGAVNKTLDTTTNSYTIPKGYHDGMGVVKIVPETKTATPTKSQQNIKPTTGKILSSVTVDPIPDEYISTTDATATEAQILTGSTAYVAGKKVTGLMKNNGALSGTIDGLTGTSYTIPAGYHNGSGKVNLTSAIEDALALI